MHVSIPTMLQEYLERNAQRHPDKTAVIFKDRRAGWGAIEDLANRVAHLLKKLGVVRQDRVVLYLDNNVEMCASIWGILHADAIFSPINAQTKVDKLVYMLNDCRARAVITEPPPITSTSEPIVALAKLSRRLPLPRAPMAPYQSRG